jgi:hypothetical protein
MMGYEYRLFSKPKFVIRFVILSEAEGRNS